MFASMMTSLPSAPSSSRVTARLQTAPCRLSGRSLPRVVRAAYDVEVEPAPPRAPNAGPSFGRSSPPPPPPPPPPQAARGLQPPSRRELLFMGLGLGLGVAGTTAYDNRPLDAADVDERLTGLLDDLLDDEALLNVLGEEILLNKQLGDSKDAVEALEKLKEINDVLNENIEELQAGGGGGGK